MEAIIIKKIVKAPAKINLGIDVPFIHQNGEIEWKMVMTAVNLYDYVEIEVLANTTTISIYSDNVYLPKDSRNLAYQAAKLFLEATHNNVGLNINIRKTIPVAAGLGGGSADAAAVLRGLNEMLAGNLTREQLAVIGLKIDSDVPFCVYSETALVSGKGEVITPIQKLPKMWFVLAKPNISVSTPKILRRLEDSTVKHSPINSLVQAIEDQNYEEMITYMQNGLEAITAAQYPEIITIKERLIKYGADCAQMSGSGPTVFGICQTESRARRIYNSLSGFCKEVYITQPIN